MGSFYHPVFHLTIEHQSRVNQCAESAQDRFTDPWQSVNGMFVVQEAAVCGIWLLIDSHKGNCLVLRKSVALATGHRPQALSLGPSASWLHGDEVPPVCL